MALPVSLTREYRCGPPPPGLPSPDELFKICSNIDPDGRNKGIAHPPDSPKFWIKYGHIVIWNEMPAQAMAHRELKRLESPVRVPAVFYACELKIPHGTITKAKPRYISYIVMEYVPGKTAARRLESDREPEKQDFVYSRLALALNELLRIPVPQGHAPTAIDGGRIWHCLFEDQHAPVHYNSVQELEDHLNKFIFMSRKGSDLRVQNLALEPMVYCYSDLWLENFIIGEEGEITVIDFSEVSFLPSSFFKFALESKGDRLNRDITALITVPETEGIDNIDALRLAAAPMIMASSSFARAGYAMLGRPPAKTIDRVEKPIFDEGGHPVEVVLEDPPPEPDNPPNPDLSPDFAKFLEEYLKKPLDSPISLVLCL